MSHYFQQRFAEVIHLLHSNKKILFNQECYKLKSDARAVGEKQLDLQGYKLLDLT